MKFFNRIDKDDHNSRKDKDDYYRIDKDDHKFYNRIDKDDYYQRKDNDKDDYFKRIVIPNNLRNDRQLGSTFGGWS